jgi:hypothetical protein
MPIPLLNGSVHYQPFLINLHASDTIISLENVINNNHRFHRWCQEGQKLSSGDACQYPDMLPFYSTDGTLLHALPLHRHQGLYYCSNTSFLSPTMALLIKRTSVDATSTPAHHQHYTLHKPKSKGQQLVSELWSLCMEHCGGWQLRQLPKHVSGTPLVFISHSFQFNDVKQGGRVKKQPVGIDPEKVPEPQMRFFMDFGFMGASRSNYRSPRLGTDRVIECFEGFSAYLIVVDEASCYVWVFLQKSKDPPVDLICDFLALHRSTQGGVIHTDLGGE